MTYKPGDRVIVVLRTGEFRGVVSNLYRPGLYRIHVIDGHVPSAIVAEGRIRRDPEPSEVAVPGRREPAW
jgi:hypothetical protein